MNKSTPPALRLGIVGCGNISNAYFKGLAPYANLIQIVACADLDVARAKAKATEHGVSKGSTVEELMADPDVDAILNLTIPAAHAQVNFQALRAGKHAYCEKPFALTYAEGLKAVEEAQARKLRVGCAPDTVLGPGIQTCRRLIDEGAIGRPVAAVANMLSYGPEHWHPSPEFFYQFGGGPLFDMGPYYLTSLITMLGPIKSVSALARKSFPERMIGSEPLKGKMMKVEIPTHLSGVLDFENGAAATVTMSFDIWHHNMPRLEVYGSEGSIQCPDPNCFDGDVLISTRKNRDWTKVPLIHDRQQGRGLGLADMADAIRHDRPHRQSGELGLHVVEVMEAFGLSSENGKRQDIKSNCQQPKAMPADLPAENWV